MNKDSIIIKGENVSIGYRKQTVYRELNFQLYRGELTCLLGANGIGKSTLLRTLSATQPALCGNISLLGKPVSSYSEEELSRTVGVVLTDRTYAGGLTVRELVSLGRQPHTGFFGRLHQSDKDIIEHAINAVGIARKANCYTAELSDGERQKVMIAKALVQESPLILLDEPTAFLDVISRIEIMMLLHRLATEEQKAILLSTHDVEQALVLADRLWLLTDENGLECGVTEDLILNNRMDSLFPNKEIRFDLMHGIYSPTVQGKQNILLTAGDETLRHWAQNALNRNGFFCLSDENKSKNYPLQLEISGKDRLKLTQNGEEYIHKSFESLLTSLKQKTNIAEKKYINN